MLQLSITIAIAIFAFSSQAFALEPRHKSTQPSDHGRSSTVPVTIDAMPLPLEKWQANALIPKNLTRDTLAIVIFSDGVEFPFEPAYRRSQGALIDQLCEAGVCVITLEPVDGFQPIAAERVSAVDSAFLALQERIGAIDMRAIVTTGRTTSIWLSEIFAQSTSIDCMIVVTPTLEGPHKPEEFAFYRRLSTSYYGGMVGDCGISKLLGHAIAAIENQKSASDADAIERLLNAATTRNNATLIPSPDLLVVNLSERLDEYRALSDHDILWVPLGSALRDRNTSPICNALGG